MIKTNIILILKNINKLVFKINKVIKPELNNIN